MNDIRLFFLACFVLLSSTASGQGIPKNLQLGIGVESGTYSQDVPFHPDGLDELDVVGFYLAAETSFSEWLLGEIKLGYNWGEEDVEYQNYRGRTETTELTLETMHLDASAKPFYSITPELIVYGKLGVTFMTRWMSGGGSLFTNTDTGFGFVFGAGAAYTLSTGLGFHAEINQVQGDDAEYAMFLFGIHKSF